MSTKSTRNNKYNNNSKILTSTIIGTFAGIVSCALLLIICAVALTKSSGIPHLAVSPLVMAVAGIGAFIGGYVSALTYKQNGMMCGLICGFIMFLILFIASLITVRTSLSMNTIIRLLLMLLTGAIGGILGVNKRKKIKY